MANLDRHGWSMNVDKIMLKLMQSIDKAPLSNICALTSIEKGAGTTFVIGKMVPALAGTGKRILLLDLNYLDPALGIQMGLSQSFELMRPDNIKPIIEDTKVESIKIAGVSTQGLNLALFSNIDLTRDFLMKISADFDMVIIDLPAISSSYLYQLISTALKEITIVVQAEVTKAREIERVLGDLEKSSVIVKGFIFNQRQDHIPGFIRRKLP